MKSNIRPSVSENFGVLMQKKMYIYKIFQKNGFVHGFPDNILHYTATD